MSTLTMTMDALRAVPLSIRQKCALELLESAQQLHARWLPFEMHEGVAEAVEVLFKQEVVCRLLAQLLTEDLDRE